MSTYTPEQEAYADFLEEMLRWMWRSGGWIWDLERRYSNPIDKEAHEAKEFIESLSEAGKKTLRAMLNENLRGAYSESLYLMKGLDIRNRAGVRLEDGLGLDAHLEWLMFTDPVKVRPAWNVHPKSHLDDWMSVKTIEQDNWRRYTAPIIGSDAVEAWLTERRWEPDAGKVLVAEQEDWEDIVGFVRVDVDSESTEAEITALHVQRFFQGRNLGKQLLGAAAQAAHEGGARSLLLWVLEDSAYTAGFCEKRGAVRGTRREAVYAPGFYEVAYYWNNLEALVEEGNRFK